MRGIRIWRAGWAAAAAAALAGCTVHLHPAPPSPLQQLRRLATAGVHAQFTATYLLTTPGSATQDQVTVYRSSSGIRVDIATAHGTALAIITPAGAYSCDIANGRAACYVAAGPGGTLPSYLDPGLERVFGSYLVDLSARSSSRYLVTSAGTTAAATGRPAGRCFQVSGGPGGPDAVAAGKYCLASDGVPTLVSYPPGQLELLTLSGAPPASALVPPASPTPLPSPG